MRFGAHRACGNSLKLLAVSLGLAALAACSGSPTQAPADTRAVINPDRSARGNPAYYEVNGKRYYVLASSDGFRERGIASWYGRDFHGRSTSSGETYDMNAMTAAHKTLPIPTWVEVTNLANGRRVIVKVNDRGPFVDGRIIDVSQRAAQQLGMIEAGTARVQVRALGAPDTDVPPPTQVAALAPAPRSGGGGFSVISQARADVAGPNVRPFRPYYVQVGAFADRNNAARLAERLKDGGFKSSFVLTTGDGRDRLHRVRIGPIDAGDYDRIAADLRAAGVREARLVQDN
jgi:peptidoglycan lytic transglycosylase